MSPLDMLIVRVATVFLAVALVLGIAGVIDLRDPRMVDHELAAAVYATIPEAAPTPGVTTTATVDSASTAEGPVAVVESAAERIPTPTTTPPAPPTTTQPAAGDCDAWLAVFTRYGATSDEVEFFRPIIWRESRCGGDLLNDSTGDTGPCQINPVHNRAGWFGGREFGDGGWLLALHGLTARHDLDNTEWANACLTLYRVCSAGAWRPPYSCANRRLP